MLVPRTPHAEHHYYSLLQARSIASRTRRTANRSSGSSTHGATPSHTDNVVPRRLGYARLFHSQGLGDEVIRAPVLLSCTRPFFQDCLCARPLKRSGYFYIQPHVHVCARSHPFCARGGFPGNAETACLRPC